LSRSSRRKLRAAKRKANAVPLKAFRIGGAGKPAIIGQAETTDGKAKVRRFSMTAYTGVPMNLEGFFYPVIVDLKGVRPVTASRPIFRQHDPLRVVGHTDAVKVTAGGIEVAGVLSGVGEDTAEVTQTADNGFPWQASIGADPIRMEFLEAGATTQVNGREVAGPMYLSRETELGEISFVPLGADGNTSAKVAASAKGSRAMDFAAYCASMGLDAETMDETAKAAVQKCWQAAQADDSSTADSSPVDPKTEGAVKLDLKAAAAAAAEEGRKAARQAAANEAKRESGIRAAVKKQGVTEVEVEKDGKKVKVDLLAHALESDWSADTAELHALRAARPGPGTGGPHLHFPGELEINEQVIEAAILQAAGSQFRLEDDSFYKDEQNGRRRVPEYLQRKTQGELKARYTDKVQQTAHTRFKGRIGLHQVLTAMTRENGYTGPEKVDDGNFEEVLRANKWTIKADGSSTASLANVLANVLNKMMLQGYLYVEQAWRAVTGIRAVADFKPTKSINLFGDFIYKEVGPGGELANANIQDQAFANQAKQYGRILTLSRPTIINDDLSALTTTPMLMGRGAGLKLNDLIWTLWLDTNQKDDGASTAFWAATHTIANQSANGNYISGGSSALSSASLKSAKLTFDKQVDPKGFPLGVEAEYLLVPPDLDQTAWELMNSSAVVMAGLASTAAASLQPSSNRWVGKYTPVMSRYLSNTNYTGYSTTAWWLLANPAILAAIEAAFLNGQEAPTVTQAGPDFQFNIPGISIRGLFDVGVGMQNFRAGVKSAGA